MINIAKKKKKTNTLLIKAFTTSEWDSCDCCLINYDPTTLSKWKWYDEQFNKIKSTSPYPDELISMNICQYARFLLLESVDDKYAEILNWLEETVDSQSFIKVEIDLGDELPTPEQKIVGTTMTFLGDGYVRFKGYGKHSDEEFFTSDFKITDL